MHHLLLSSEGESVQMENLYRFDQHRANNNSPDFIIGRRQRESG